MAFPWKNVRLVLKERRRLEWGEKDTKKRETSNDYIAGNGSF